jgi:hypothetical protein
MQVRSKWSCSSTIFDSLFSSVGQSHLAAELLQSQGADFPVHLDVFDKKNAVFSADMNN